MGRETEGAKRRSWETLTTMEGSSPSMEERTLVGIGNGKTVGLKPGMGRMVTVPLEWPGKERPVAFNLGNDGIVPLKPRKVVFRPGNGKEPLVPKGKPGEIGKVVILLPLKKPEMILEKG